MDNHSLSAAFQIDGWLVEPSLNQLSLDGRSVRVEPKVMEVLVCLAESDGRPVSKEQFMQSVWAGTIVTDDVLSRCISELRKIFGDNPKNPRYIETIRKRGYRLVQPVVIPEDPAAKLAVAAKLEAAAIAARVDAEEKVISWKDVSRTVSRKSSSLWARKSSPWVWGRRFHHS